jgi:hypothetical protein
MTRCAPQYFFTAIRLAPPNLPGSCQFLQLGGRLAVFFAQNAARLMQTMFCASVETADNTINENGFGHSMQPGVDLDAERVRSGFFCRRSLRASNGLLLSGPDA